MPVISSAISLLLALVASITSSGARAAAAPSTAAATAVATAAPNAPLVVLSSSQVSDALYETLNWYRALGAQSSTDAQASDTLIVFANRQVATEVVHLALDMARADAELLSSEANGAPSAPGVAKSAEALNAGREQLQAQARQIQAELQTTRQSSGVSSDSQRSYASAKISELEGELAVVNAQTNLLDTMAQFVNQSDATSTGANALKETIAAIEASLPSVTAAATASTTASTLTATGTTRRLGIWDLASSVFNFEGRIGAIDSLDQSSASLEATLDQLRATPLQALKALSARSDALSTRADRADSAAMQEVRNQLDTVAWQLKQTAAILVPLNKQHVLLEQYRQNLAEWRGIVRREEHSALIGLAVRLGVLALVLAVLFAGGELWRRAVLRYEHEARRRNQWLLVRRFTLWTLVITVVGFTFVTQLSSIATFAGLITAGLAVAMQSVIVSVVGYFFLIGKYGVRVGDRVQINDVAGEVVELGLVRMHLMELNPKSDFAATGRIVAFANSIVFQSSGGLFRQIPGVNFAWHDITLTLPAGIDYDAAKEAMRAAVTEVVKQYQDNMVRQTTQLQETFAARDAGKALPRVQLHFSASDVQAHVWYPVYLPHAAEIDERVSQELWKAVAAVAAHPTESQAVLSPRLGEPRVRQ
jgi:small-conductance mechanosensitive channel